MNLDVYLRYTEKRISYHKKILNMFLNFINIINFDKNKNNDTCSVCLDSLCNIKLPCNHIYHPEYHIVLFYHQLLELYWFDQS